MSFLLLLTAVALAQTPVPQSPGAEATATLEAGKTALAEGEFERAISVLDAASRQTMDDTLLGRIHLARGEAYAALQEYGAMEVAFAQALTHDPDIRLDPTLVDPKRVSLLEALRNTLHGQLDVVVTPPGATLVLDGQTLGPAPWQGGIAIGTHSLEIVPPAGNPVLIHVKVRPDRTERVRFEFPQNPPTAAGSPGPLAFTVQARGVTSIDRPFALGGEIGAGLGGRTFFGELNGTAGAAFGVSARVGARARRWIGPLSPRVSLDGFLVFAGGAIPGFGVSGGAELDFGMGIVPFAEVSGRLLAPSDAFRTSAVMGTLGVRFELGNASAL
ncbi:MAG: PEGA domain-containing protein [Myxococcaceae bacterium]